MEKHNGNNNNLFQRLTNDIRVACILIRVGSVISTSINLRSQNCQHNFMELNLHKRIQMWNKFRFRITVDRPTSHSSIQLLQGNLAGWVDTVLLVIQVWAPKVVQVAISNQASRYVFVCALPNESPHLLESMKSPHFRLSDAYLANTTMQ